MPRKRCPECERKLPYAGRRCIHCEWSVREGDAGAPPRGRGRWRAAVAGAVLLAATAAGVRNAPMLADWYAGFAAENLWAGASSFAPAETEAGAYFYCARQVAKRMNSDYSVETFPSPAEGELRSLGDGRYRVESFVDEAREDGTRVRYGFVCSVAFEAGRWTLEELNLTERHAVRD